MRIEKEVEIGNLMDLSRWGLPLRLSLFRVNNEFNELIGNVGIVEIGFLCFGLRIERWELSND